MLEIIIEFILELVFNVIIQFIGEILVEFGLRSLGEVFHRTEKRDPLFELIGYAIWGLILGGISVWIIPHHIIKPSKYYGISLIISPFVTGMLMSLIGSYKAKKGLEIFRLDSFRCGFVFAFGIAAIRYYYLSGLK